MEVENQPGKAASESTGPLQQAAQAGGTPASASTTATEIVPLLTPAASAPPTETPTEQDASDESAVPSSEHVIKADTSAAPTLSQSQGVCV